MPNELKAELSLGQRLDLIHEAVYRVTERPAQPYVEASYGYCVAVFDDYLVLRMDEKFWRVEYTITDDDKVELARRTTWQEVEQEWVAAKMFQKVGARNSRSDKQRVRDIRKAARSINDTTMEMEPDDEDPDPDKSTDVLVQFGGAIKALGNGKVGGYLVRFTNADDPDLTGDFFTKETDFDIENGDRVTVYYNHGLDPVLKKRKLGRGTVILQDAGIWMEAQLETRDDYERAIYQMVEAGKLGWSSGTLPSLMEREPVGKAMWIKSWPIGKDGSLTPTPAAGPILTAVQTLKHLANATIDLQALTQQAAGDAATQGATGENGGGISDTRAAKRLRLELDLLTLQGVAL